jgi:hypothetical protein
LSSGEQFAPEKRQSGVTGAAGPTYVRLKFCNIGETDQKLT